MEAKSYGKGSKIPWRRWSIFRYKIGMEVTAGDPNAMMKQVPQISLRESRTWVAVRRLLRARITAGLIVILPIWITYLLVKFLFELMRDASLWAVETYLTTGWGSAFVSRWAVSPEAIKDNGLEAFGWKGQWIIGIFCVLLTVFFLYSVGMLTANFIGKRVIAGVEVLLDRVPLVKTVYRATKQILATLAGDQAQNFQRVVLVPFPNRETRSIGFITSVTHDSRTGEELCAVFIASTPNPTTGFVFVLPRTDLIDVDWTVEDAISMIMSGGAIFPAASMSAASPSSSPVKPPRVPAIV